MSGLDIIGSARPLSLSPSNPLLLVRKERDQRERKGRARDGMEWKGGRRGGRKEEIKEALVTWRMEEREREREQCHLERR